MNTYFKLQTPSEQSSAMSQHDVIFIREFLIWGFYASWLRGVHHCLMSKIFIMATVLTTWPGTKLDHSSKKPWQRKLCDQTNPRLSQNNPTTGKYSGLFGLSRIIPKFPNCNPRSKNRNRIRRRTISWSGTILHRIPGQKKPWTMLLCSSCHDVTTSRQGKVLRQLMFNSSLSYRARACSSVSSKSSYSSNSWMLVLSCRSCTSIPPWIRWGFLIDLCTCRSKAQNKCNKNTCDLLLIQIHHNCQPQHQNMSR